MAAGRASAGLGAGAGGGAGMCRRGPTAQASESCPGWAGDHHHPPTLQRVTSGPSASGWVRHWWLGKMVRAKTTRHVAEVPGCTLPGARLPCFQPSQTNGCFSPHRPVPQFPISKVKAPSRLPALHTVTLFGKHRAPRQLSLRSGPVGAKALYPCISPAPALGLRGEVRTRARCCRPRRPRLWQPISASPFPEARREAAVSAEPRRKQLSCEAPSATPVHSAGGTHSHQLVLLRSFAGRVKPVGLLTRSCSGRFCSSPAAGAGGGCRSLCLGACSCSRARRRGCDCSGDREGSVAFWVCPSLTERESRASWW